MPQVHREIVGICHDCENGSIIKETLTPKQSRWVEIRADESQVPLPEKTFVFCYCHSCGHSYHLDTILKLNVKHAQ